MGKGKIGSNTEISEKYLARISTKKKLEVNWYLRQHIKWNQITKKWD